MLQELTDLDFDTYFDVASSSNQQQQNRDVLYNNDDSTSLRNNPLLNNNNNRQQSLYQYTQQQQEQQRNFNNLFDWDISPSTSSHISSPQSSSDGYTSHSLSPQMMNINSPPPFYNIKDGSLEGFFAERSIYSSSSMIPGITISATPINESPPPVVTTPPSSTTNLPSPHSLSGAYSTIDQWCQQLKEQDVVNPLDNHHETRHWRKTSIRHQQFEGNNSEPPGKQLKKVAHNAIERRYRNNINDRIRELKNVVPALYKARIREKVDHDDDDDSSMGGDYYSGDEQENDIVIVDGVEVAKKLNKATILCKATEYIQFLKNTNDTTEQENLILQQIIAQMPGGNNVLARFLCQKNEFEKSEHDRLSRERRETQERERTERQRVLRERAAQRAALAQLLPKPERRPYRRRQQSSKNNTTNKKASSSLDDGGNNKMFMAAFMCIAFFSTSPLPASSSHHAYGPTNQTSPPLPNSFYQSSTAASSFIDFWHILRYTLYIIGIFYICFIPLLLVWLRPRPVIINNNNNNKKKCLDHYANKVHTVWTRLYTIFCNITMKTPQQFHSNEPL